MGELKRIETFVLDLQKKVMKECDNFSEDVKYWAEYKTGIKSFRPWLEGAELKSTEGLSKPQTLDEANSMFATVNDFDQACIKHLKVLNDASAAANKMTTHKEADDEVAGLKGRYEKVKAVSDEWMKKVNNNSHWRKWNLLSVNSKISSKKKKSWWKICNVQIALPFTNSFRNPTDICVVKSNNSTFIILSHQTCCPWI